ncbi:Photosystem II protein PsbJ, partial [uncultured Synechococcales cyanobacterium]
VTNKDSPVDCRNSRRVRCNHYPRHLFLWCLCGSWLFFI